ncbi:MAG: hypothetical protein ABSG09_00210 [Acidimicrobiales bacterium]
MAGSGGAATGPAALGPRRFIPFIMVIALALAAVVTAVLSASSPASGSTAVRSALDSVTQAKSVTFALSVNLSGTSAAQASVDGSCATGPACEVTFSASSGTSSIGQSQLVIDNGVAYVRLAAPLASHLPTPWVSAPLSSSGAQHATGISSMVNLSSVLAGLSKVGDTVTDDGVVTLNAAPTHEYTVSASQATEQQQVESVLKALPTTDVSVLGAVTVGGYHVDVYVDPDGNLAEVDLSTSVSTSSGSESLSLRLALSNYGQPVSVSVPPANEVTPYSSLKSSFLGL